MQRINFLFNSHQICRLANLSLIFKSFFSFKYSSSPIHYSSVTCIQGPPILSPGNYRQSIKWKPFFALHECVIFPWHIYGTGRLDSSYMERLGSSWLGIFGWGDHLSYRNMFLETFPFMILHWNLLQSWPLIYVLQ